MVVPDHLVVLKVPAFNLTILSTREKVGLPGGDSKTSDNGDMAGKRDLQLATGQVPDLDHPVRCSRCKPLVSRFNGTAAHPAHVSRYNPEEFPGGVPCRLGHTGALSDSQLMPLACTETRQRVRLVHGAGSWRSNTPGDWRLVQCNCSIGSCLFRSSKISLLVGRHRFHLINLLLHLSIHRLALHLPEQCLSLLIDIRQVALIRHKHPHVLC